MVARATTSAVNSWTLLPAWADATADFVDELTDSDWNAVTDGWSFDVPVRGALVHLLHDLEHHLLDVRRGYARLALADGIEVVTSRPSA